MGKQIKYSDIVIYAVNDRAYIGLVGSRCKRTSSVRIIPLYAGGCHNVRRDENTVITLADIKEAKEVLGRE